MGPSSADRDSTSEHTAAADSQLSSVATTRSDEDARRAIEEYLLTNSEQYRELARWRQEVWRSPAADRHFARRRANADRTSGIAHSDEAGLADADSVSKEKSPLVSKKAKKTAHRFYRMMQDIGRELHTATGAFNVARLDESPPHILDMCMAPGGFLSAALQCNPDAVATAYTLPFGGSTNGHLVFLPDNVNVEKTYLDITMLAADMGVERIPEDHPESLKFLTKQFEADRIYDIVICDGHVQRNHKLAAYREHRETRRLIMTQLALGLEHLKPFGTMIVLVNKVETEQPKILGILHQFHKFSSVQLCKPTKGYADRSSFYMVATDIQTDHAEATKAVEEWKRTWKIATFGSEDEFSDHIRRDSVWANKMLENFGPVLIEKSRAVWETQIRGLMEAPYMKCAQSQPQKAC